MKIATLCLAVSLAIGGSAFAAEREPQGAGIFTPFAGVGDQCVQLKTIQAAGAQFMPLKDGSFRLIEGFYVAIPPVSRELPPGDRAVLAIGPKGEMMALIVDGEQTCARFMLPDFMQEMVANVESGNEAPKAGSGL
jgi:hypothetical protein